MMGFCVYFLVFFCAALQLSMHMFAQKNEYDVMKFGAIGNGKNDDSKAFQSAWKAACNENTDDAIISVPNGKTFLVSPTRFEGPCKTRSIKFQINGNVVAPSKSDWKNSNKDEWLGFHGVDGLSVVGNGQIDGQGASWWEKGTADSRPREMQFSTCKNVEVSGLTFINSQRNHISVDNCDHVSISNLHINSPKNSPNTDGIDISSTTNLQIHDCTIQTGDDCIAMRGITSNIQIFNIKCGPGHGISVGSLGGEKRDEVQNILVNNCTLKETENGVRIKALPGGSGFGKNISFSNITFNEVKNPIIIDQHYCPHGLCVNQASKIPLSDVRYIRLTGTSISKNPIINFDCSEVAPCTKILVKDVYITASDPNLSPQSSQCNYANGTVQNCSSPILNCLRD